ncbi:MAG: D-alanyl-D-alanine carboxypeptidase/D-alanyl-D-alanine endopeptidase [Candidatus Kapaibacteriota bacterium]
MKRRLFPLLIFVLLFEFLGIRYSIVAQKSLFTTEDSIKSINFLRKQIFEVLQNFKEDKNNYGIAIYSLDKKEYYFKHNIESYFIPASLTKLFTTFSAIHKLGVDYKVKTYLYADGQVVNGILEGNLYIYGTGDALFNTNDLDNFVVDVQKFGIKRINGSIFADPFFFDSQTDRFVYSGDLDVVQKTQPITSIAIQKNILTIIVSAGSIYGRGLNIQVLPESEAIKVYSTAKVSKSIGNKDYYDEKQFQGYGGSNLIVQRRISTKDSYSQQALKVSCEINDGGGQTLWISGRLPANTSKTYTFFIENPPLVVAGALKTRLQKAGITVSGTFGIKQVPFDKAQVISIVSRDIKEILKEMDKESDNYLAETVFKMIGAVEKRMTSNSKEAIRYIFSLLDSLKIPCLDCKMYDGSGLSRRNRFTPESIILLLLNIKQNPNFSFFDSLLAVAGFDGTLKNRMVGTKAAGRVFAKTGTHSNASGLAGYIKTLDNERLAFVFMYNGQKVMSFKKLEDEICRILAEFFYSNIQE